MFHRRFTRFAVFLTCAALVVSGLSCSRTKKMDRVVAEAVKGDIPVLSGIGSMTFEDFLRKTNRDDPLSEIAPGDSTVQERIDLDCVFKGSKQYSMRWYGGRGKLPCEEIGWDGFRMWTVTTRSADEKGLFAAREVRYRPYNRYVFEPDKYDPLAVGLTIMDQPVGAFLKHAASDSAKAWGVIKKPVLKRGETVDGLPCAVVEVTIKNGKGEKTGPPRVYRLWLAPGLRYRAVKVQTSEPNFRRIFQIRYQEVGDSLLFPQTIEFTRFRGGVPDIHRKLTVHNDWQVNVTLPDSLFNLRVPEGRKIIPTEEFLNR